MKTVGYGYQEFINALSERLLHMRELREAQSYEKCTERCTLITHDTFEITIMLVDLHTAPCEEVSIGQARRQAVQRTVRALLTVVEAKHLIYLRDATLYYDANVFDMDVAQLII